MKSKILIIALLIGSGQLVNVFGQNRPGVFVVKNVYINTDANPRFVRRYVDKIISWHKESNKDEIECLKKEVTETQLLKSFETKLEKVEHSDDYDLILTVSYKSVAPTYTLSRIEIIDFVGLDKSIFDGLIAKNGFIGKSLSLKAGFPAFEDQIIDITKASIEKDGYQDEISDPWLEMRLNASGELEVTIMPSFKGCAKH